MSDKRFCVACESEVAPVIEESTGVKHCPVCGKYSALITANYLPLIKKNLYNPKEILNAMLEAKDMGGGVVWFRSSIDNPVVAGNSMKSICEVDKDGKVMWFNRDLNSNYMHSIDWRSKNYMVLEGLEIS